MLGVLLIIAALYAAARGIRTNQARSLGILGAMVCVFISVALGVLLARGEGRFLQLLGVDTSVAHPAHLGPVLIGYLAAATVGVGLFALMTVRFVRGAEIGLAVTLILAMLSSATAWAAPGVSFLFALPASLLCTGGIVIRQRGNVGARWARVGIAALLVTAPLTLTPLHNGLLNAFGVGDPGLAVLPMLFGALLLLPALMGEGRSSAVWLAVIGLIAALLAGVFVRQLPMQTPALPGHVNLVHEQTHSEVPVAEGEEAQPDRAFWTVDGGRAPVEPGLLEELSQALGGGDDPVEAPLSSDAPPSLEVLGEWLHEGGATVLSVKVLPGRRTDELLVELRGFAELIVDGTTMPGKTVRFLGPSEEGVEFQIRDDGGPFGLSARLVSQQYGLRGVRGRAAEDYFGVRPAEFVPYSSGDRSEMATFKELRPREEDLEKRLRETIEESKK